MPLTWDITGCAQPDELTADESVRELTRALVFETMAVGIGTITAENAEEFWLRSCLWRTLQQFPCFTLDTVKRYVGLRCNVAKVASVPWRTRVIKGWQDDARHGRARLTYYGDEDAEGKGDA